jgi:hypothetical protein
VAPRVTRCRRSRRLPQLQAFAHLKTLTLVRYGKGYPEEMQAKVKALLPKVDVKFVK